MKSNLVPRAFEVCNWKVCVKSTTALSWMPFSDYLRYSLIYSVGGTETVRSKPVNACGRFFADLDQLSEFRMASWFMPKKLDYSLSISIRNSWPGLRPRQPSRDAWELIIIKNCANCESNNEIRRQDVYTQTKLKKNAL